MVCHFNSRFRFRGGDDAMNRPLCKGFSLIELIIIIVVVSIAAVGMLALFGGVGLSLAINEDTQTAAQLGQECSEHILAARRNPKIGYSAINNVNAYDSRLKGWMDRFHGVATRHLASYLGWRRLLERYPGGPASSDVLRTALGIGWCQQLRVT